MDCQLQEIFFTSHWIRPHRNPPCWPGPPRKCDAISSSIGTVADGGASLGQGTAHVRKTTVSRQKNT